MFLFFSPPFCLLVYFILFWLFFVLSFVLFCFVFGFVSCFLSFRTSSPRNFVLLLVCVHFLLFIFVHSFFFLCFGFVVKCLFSISCCFVLFYFVLGN